MDQLKVIGIAGLGHYLLACKSEELAVAELAAFIEGLVEPWEQRHECLDVLKVRLPLCHSFIDEPLLHAFIVVTVVLGPLSSISLIVSLSNVILELLDVLNVIDIPLELECACPKDLDLLEYLDPGEQLISYILAQLLQGVPTLLPSLLKLSELFFFFSEISVSIMVLIRIVGA